MNTQNLPIALEAIVKLNFKCEGPQRIGRFETYLTDLSDWNLSFTDKTPCVWVKQKDLLELKTFELAESIKDVIRKQGWQNSTVLVFLDGEIGDLSIHLPPALPVFVLFSIQEQTQIQEANSPSKTTLSILLGKLSRSQLAPYETHKPVTGSRFFGRQKEINKVLQHDSNYLFVGIRRVGKTSLLKEIQRRMDQFDPPEEGLIRRMYVDCTVIQSEDEFFRKITLKLAPSEMKLLMGRPDTSPHYRRLLFDRFSDMHGGPVTFFIDELDRLLQKIGPDSDLFDVLRAASNAGKARFIMAGFRQAMEATSNVKTPFYNLADEIRLGKLNREEVRKMVLVPFERLHISIKNREGVINRMTRETAGLPNYLQFYCKTLLDYLDDEQRNEVTEDDMQYVYENREFRDFVLDTFTSNTNQIEQIIIYGLISENYQPVDQNNYSFKDIDLILKKRNLSITLRELESACRNLEIAGFFNEVGTNFSFAIPLLRSMLFEMRDVNFLFSKTREEIIENR